MIISTDVSLNQHDHLRKICFAKGLSRDRYDGITDLHLYRNRLSDSYYRPYMVVSIALADSIVDSSHPYYRDAINAITDSIDTTDGIDSIGSYP